MLLHYKIFFFTINFCRDVHAESPVPKRPRSAVKPPLTDIGLTVVVFRRLQVRLQTANEWNC